MAEATRPSADDAAGRALIEEPPMVEFLKRLFEKPGTAAESPLEEHLVRKVAGLLHVPHPDFIDAKIRARRSLG